MRVMSTSWTVVSWADTRSDSVIRWAITCRSRGSATVELREDAAAGPWSSGAAGVAGASTFGDAVADASAAAACATARTSRLRIRLPGPVPTTVSRSTPCAAASR
jgi:hypothetical protein